jgi:hypothetical protein
MPSLGRNSLLITPKPTHAASRRCFPLLWNFNNARILNAAGISPAPP